MLPKLMKLEDEIVQKNFRSESHKLGVNIIFTFNWVNHFHSGVMKKFDLTSQQFNILRILRGQHPAPANIKLLRERMLDKMSDASRIVEKLRAKGLVERVTNESDRRACDVNITRKGLDLLKIIDKEDITFDNFFSNLSCEEIKVLNDLLDKLRG
ncbi:MAG TPA: MarR family transcriptional regulator [Bacteroidia bacterium]|nr:MarR family transcriptional regulator [Bacteroidia bacterium]